MGIPRDRIQSRKPMSPEDWEGSRALSEAARRICSIDGRLGLAMTTLHTYGPLTYSGPLDPNILEEWPLFRRNLKVVADYIQKRENGGRVPARLRESLSDLKNLFVDLCQNPTIPGSPWVEIRAILTKAGFSDEPLDLHQSGPNDKGT